MAFLSLVDAWPIVALVFDANSSTVADCSCNALIKISVVSIPSAASFRNSPLLTPNARLKASIAAGAFSATLLNSSPRITPLANAWLNCKIAASACCVPAPDIANVFANVSVTRDTSLTLNPNLSAF